MTEDGPWLDRSGLDFSAPVSRLGAGLIDWLLSLAVAGGAASAVTRLDVEGEGLELVAATLAMGLVHLFLYPAMVGLVGFTPGKAMLGLRVITADLGEMPPGRPAAFRRSLPLWLGAIPTIGPYFVIALLVANAGLVVTDPERRSLADRVGRTLVVRP